MILKLKLYRICILRRIVSFKLFSFHSLSHSYLHAVTITHSSIEPHFHSNPLKCKHFRDDTNRERLAMVVKCNESEFHNNWHTVIVKDLFSITVLWCGNHIWDETERVSLELSCDSFKIFIKKLGQVLFYKLM